LPHPLDIYINTCYTVVKKVTKEQKRQEQKRTLQLNKAF